MQDPFGPPMLRPDLPTYPVHTQLLRVTGATVAGPSGVTQVVGSSVLAPPLYIAYVQQRMNDTGLPRDREPCLVADVVGRGLEPAPTDGTFRFREGRLTGTWNGLPVYTVVDQRAAMFKIGILDGQLVYQGSTSMSVKTRTPTGSVATGEKITVYDWLLSTGDVLPAGTQASANWDSSSGLWILTGAQCP